MRIRITREERAIYMGMLNILRAAKLKPTFHHPALPATPPYYVKVDSPNGINAYIVYMKNDKIIVQFRTDTEDFFTLVAPHCEYFELADPKLFSKLVVYLVEEP